MWFSCALFVVFGIYRGIKTTFSLYSAVVYDTFTKKNFKKSLEVTKNQWWRIV